MKRFTKITMNYFHLQYLSKYEKKNFFYKYATYIFIIRFIFRINKSCITLQKFTFFLLNRCCECAYLEYLVFTITRHNYIYKLMEF